MTDGRRSLLAAGWMGLAGAVVLAGYDATRAASSALLARAYGEGAAARVLSAMPLGVLLVLYAVGRLLSRLGARRTLLVTSLSSAAALLGCYAALAAGSRPAAVVFAFVREVYVVLLIEQIWSFLDSTFDARGARTWNGPVTGVGSLGALAGALLIAPLAATLGAHAMLLVSVGTVVVAAAVADFAYRRLGEPKPDPGDEARRRGELGLRPLLASRTLLCLFGVVLVTRVLSTSVSLHFDGAVRAGFADPARGGAFSGGVYALLNAVIAAMQFVAAPLLLRNLPVAAVWIGMPVAQLALALVALAAPSTSTAAAGLVLFRAFEYSLFRDAKEIFYLPMTFEVRYRTKLLLDVFGHRIGKGLLALALGAPTLANTRLVRLSGPLSAGAAALWLVLAVAMVRSMPRREGAH